MRRPLACLGVLGCVLGATPGNAAAQSGDSLIVTGMRAYKNLEFDVATVLLRRGVVQLTAAKAPVAQRAQGLVYLGAAELFRGRRDSAVAVFRRLVLLDPRYRPDRLVFPPEVTGVFDAVRLRTKTVAIVVPRDTEIPVQDGAFRAWLVASSFQTVNVTLLYENGTSFRPLYFGPIGDSLEVQWDGRDAAGQPVPVDRLLLRVASRAPTGELASLVQLPLDLKINRPDTLPWPDALANSELRPERAASGPATRALLGGLLLSAAVVSLPAAVGSHDTPSGPRVAVASAVGVATALGYLLHRSGRPLPANIRANDAVREEWKARVAAVRAENARRLADVRLRVHAGDPAAIEAAGP